MKKSSNKNKNKKTQEKHGTIKKIIVTKRRITITTTKASTKIKNIKVIAIRERIPTTSTRIRLKKVTPRTTTPCLTTKLLIINRKITTKTILATSTTILI